MEKKITKWDLRFLERLDQISSWSKDKNTKVGACFVFDKRVLVEGYNGLPDYLDDENQYFHEKPQKYYFFEHAERNAIQLASKNNINLSGSTCYVNWIPCPDCMRAILSQDVNQIIRDLSQRERRDDVESRFNASLLMAKSKKVNVYATFNRKTKSLITKY